MAKKKGRQRRQSMVSKIINGLLLALAFAHPIEVMLRGTALPTKVAIIVRDATFGLSEGRFNLQEGLQMYTPVGGAIALGALKSYLMKKFPIRR